MRGNLSSFFLTTFLGLFLSIFSCGVLGATAYASAPPSLDSGKNSVSAGSMESVSDYNFMKVDRGDIRDHWMDDQPLINENRGDGTENIDYADVIREKGVK